MSSIYPSPSSYPNFSAKSTPADSSLRLAITPASTTVHRWKSLQMPLKRPPNEEEHMAHGCYGRDGGEPLPPPPFQAMTKPKCKNTLIQKHSNVDPLNQRITALALPVETLTQPIINENVRNFPNTLK
ncbi:hypothetical protein ACH5RR_036427 [Cinchona calisaya]|uniref:Uncharacterized protein n=1 Tax=Cinchona calisaya TaxID=153742 RepID=A0ABD2Y8M3_9GENT